MLSSLLGPAKLSVANANDVASSGGIFQVDHCAQALSAKSADCAAEFPIGPGERCLVCLEQYQAGDQLRQLSKCVHAFHMDCIDEVRTRPMDVCLLGFKTNSIALQWLTTGRNSCPLCRRQGVSNGDETLQGG